MTHVERRPAERSASEPLLEDTSLYLIGSVAVGIIIVEGPTAGPPVQRRRADQGRRRGPGRPDLAGHAGTPRPASSSPTTSGPSGIDRARTRPSAATSRSRRTGATRPWPSSGSRATSLGVHEYVKTIRAQPRHQVGLRRVLHQVPDQPLRLRAQAEARHAVRQRRLGPRQHRPGLHPRDRPHLRLSRRVRRERLQLRRPSPATCASRTATARTCATAVHRRA